MVNHVILRRAIGRRVLAAGAARRAIFATESRFVNGESCVTTDGPEQLPDSPMAEVPPFAFDRLGARPATPEAGPLDVGRRVRALRKRRGWSLTEAADRFGIGRSTLAKLEAGNMSPTIGLLQRIAAGLEVELTTLVSRIAGEPASGRVAITRRGQGEEHRTDAHSHEILAAELARKKMMPFRSRIRFDPGRKLEWYRHEAEEFVLVLEGQISLESEHYAPVLLEEGDSAYIDGRMAHRLVAAGGRDAVVLFVIAT
jgi:transcriptional regulator with XRE-family HTH domain